MISTIDLTLRGSKVSFTTRAGGVSQGPYSSLNLGLSTGDRAERVESNRRQLAADVGLEQLVSGRQVHEATVREWVSPLGDPPAEGIDGHFTRSSELGLLVLAADCLPVALGAPGQVAMLHCGWRGLAAGIIERAVDLFDEVPDAAIGPGIGPCCYEVGPEVLAAFESDDLVHEDRMLDLKAVARRLLSKAGVDATVDVGLCTSCRADLFFSHRRDKGVTGRQGGVAWIP